MDRRGTWAGWQGEDAHTCDRRGLRLHNTRVCIPRSGARANQTDIIDLTCDLEIRKITDGERLEPIIIVNIGRPVSRFLAAVAVLTLPLILAQLYIPNLATMRPTTLASVLPPILPSSPLVHLFRYMCLPSLPPILCSLPIASFPHPVRSFHLRVSLAGTSCVQSFYLY